MLFPLSNTVLNFVRLIFGNIVLFRSIPGMGKEVENLIMENNELLATKYVHLYILSIIFTQYN